MPTHLPPSGFDISAHTQVRNASFKMHKHHHEFFELLCISEGHSHVEIRGREVVAGPGDLLIYYPYEDHHETVQAGHYSLICLRFKAELPEAQMFPAKSEAGPVVHLPWPERFQSLFAQMVAEQETKDAWSKPIALGYITVFVGLLQRALHCMPDAEDPSSDNGRARIATAIDLMHQSIDLHVSLKDLATDVCMSESHFSHTFKEVVGVSPKKYLTRTKMLKAQQLLETTEETVKSIAAAVGYDDWRHFSKVYRKAVGQSPTEYRENCRKAH